MKIATPADKLTTLAVGDAVIVNSFGHNYRATVTEMKGNRARLTWRNKSGNDFDNWLTIPGRTEKDLNPTAAATRKLRVEATKLERYAERASEDALRHQAQMIKLQALVGTQPLRVEDNQFGTRLFYFGTSDNDYVWGGYTAEAAQRYGRTEPTLTWEEALEKAIQQSQHHMQDRITARETMLARAAARRAEATAIKAGA